MTFILGEQRKGDVVAAFERYREYLAPLKDFFPPSAFALATSEWYFNFMDHKCPHDGHLQWMQLEEAPKDKDAPERVASLTIRLLGAYQDGYIELHYPHVIGYRLSYFPDLRTGGRFGHCDWLYDEFRLSEQKHVVHEIEWAHLEDTGHWLIEAKEIEFRWIPLGST